jgi:hypothetical protein
MSLYAQHNISSAKRGPGTVLCPLCRADWGPTALSQIKEDCKTTSDLKHMCAPITCIQCKLIVKTSFFRCVECSLRTSFAPSLGADASFAIHSDFCQRCYDAPLSGHSRHHFLKAESKVTMHDHAWEPISRAQLQVTPDALLTSLQSRELTAADYDLLLSLDSAAKPTLVSAIIDSIPRHTSIQVTCWCAGSGAGAHAANNLFCRKLLCCGAGVHEDCLAQALAEAISDSHSKVAGIKCPDSNCEKRIFMGLSRAKRRRRRLDSSKPECDGAATATTEPLPRPLEGIDGTQIQFITTSSSSSSLSSSSNRPPKSIRQGGAVSGRASSARLQPLLHGGSYLQDSLIPLSIKPLGNLIHSSDNSIILGNSCKPPSARINQRFSVTTSRSRHYPDTRSLIQAKVCDLGAFGQSLLSAHDIDFSSSQVSAYTVTSNRLKEKGKRLSALRAVRTLSASGQSSIRDGEECADDLLSGFDDTYIVSGKACYRS